MWFLKAADLLFAPHCNYLRQGYEGMYEHYYSQSMVRRCFSCLRDFTTKIHHFKGKLILKRYLQKPFTMLKNVITQEIDRRDRMLWLKEKKRTQIVFRITQAWSQYSSKQNNLQKLKLLVRKKLRNKKIRFTFKHWLDRVS